MSAARWSWMISLRPLGSTSRVSGGRARPSGRGRARRGAARARGGAGAQPVGAAGSRSPPRPRGTRATRCRSRSTRIARSEPALGNTRDGSDGRSRRHGPTAGQRRVAAKSSDGDHRARHARRPRSEARIRDAAATASVLTQPDRSASGIAARLPGVSMVLGTTAFTVMPCARTSWASAWVSVMTAAFDTV